jgi:glutamine cyclotransferase
MKSLLALFLCLLSGAVCAADKLPVYGYKIVHAYPHDPGAFTEGLFYRDGLLYESTGLEGRSSIRKVKLETGEVLFRRDLPAAIFGEGIVDWNDRLIGLTWRTQIGYVADLASFELLRQFSYVGEGWGMTRNDATLFMSDGTSELRVLDPETLEEKRRIKVTAAGAPIDQLNELEWVKGEIFANIWQSDRIARINPQNGHVTGWIDLSGILASQGPIAGRPDVLNGIAYDAKADRLFVTGKFWPWLFEIMLVRK